MKSYDSCSIGHSFKAFWWFWVTVATQIPTFYVASVCFKSRNIRSCGSSNVRTSYTTIQG